MRARDFMTSSPVFCLPDTSLEKIARLMAIHDCGALPVVDHEATRRPIGIITDRDIVMNTLAVGRDPGNATAKECMSGPCIAVDTDATFEACCAAMEAHQIRRLVVVDEDGALCGIVAQADLARTGTEDLVGEVVQEISLDTRVTF